MKETETVIVRNRCQCRKCGDVIESTDRHDFVRCGCGSIFTDGGRDYVRRGAENLSDIIDLCETEEVVVLHEDEIVEEQQKILKSGVTAEEIIKSLNDKELRGLFGHGKEE